MSGGAFPRKNPVPGPGVRGGEFPRTGVVLAGGRSTRMGVDKATLAYEGRRLVDRAIDRLAEVCEPVIVVTGDRSIADLAVAQVRDAGVGPLGGIVAGLGQVTTPLAAVVAVDMPFADPALLQRLAEAWDGEPAVVPVAGGCLQPLHAIYAAAAVDDLAALLDAGERSPARALELLGCRRIQIDDPTFAVNLNRVEDLPPAGRPAAG